MDLNEGKNEVLCITIGVLALQGAFREHLKLLDQAARKLTTRRDKMKWIFKEVRNSTQLQTCDGLIIPGGESTSMSLVAQRSNLLEPIRNFVKVAMKPTWGTCAGLILLAEAANQTKHGGQELIGGLDIQVNRNHFGRQMESFESFLHLPFLQDLSSYDKGHTDSSQSSLFRAIFIRAPIVESFLPVDSVPSRNNYRTPVEVMARLPWCDNNPIDEEEQGQKDGAIVAVRQSNVFGTSFHPELTQDDRLHQWWLEQVLLVVDQKDS